MIKIDKEKYFEISKELELPSRCPILTCCERRSLTRFMSLYKDLNIDFEQFKKNEIKDGYLDNPIIPQQGESATFAGGANNWGLSRICPEVSLFESEIVPFDSENLAVTSASYDKYLPPSQRTIIHETGHFSQCIEFIKYQSRKGNESKSDIIELKPSFYGIKIDLKALYRKLFKSKK